MSLAPDEIEQERTRFEAAMQKMGRVGYIEWSDGLPVWTSDKADWQIWLAAIESERERVRNEQDDAESVTEKLGRFWPSGERGE